MNTYYRAESWRPTTRTTIARGELAGVEVEDRTFSDVESFCGSCGVNVHDIAEWYMVNDDVWPSRAFASDVNQYLCVGCLEGFIGRPLRPDDFTDCPLNVQNLLDGSLRLRRRLVGRWDDRIDPDVAVDVAFQRIGRLEQRSAWRCEARILSMHCPDGDGVQERIMWLLDAAYQADLAAHADWAAECLLAGIEAGLEESG